MPRGIISRYIVVDTSIRDGQPTFRGTEITVAEILDKVATGMPWETIIRESGGQLRQEAISEAMMMARQALLEHTGVPAKETVLDDEPKPPRKKRAAKPATSG